jgi:carboxypeptidase family protein
MRIRWRRHLGFVVIRVMAVGVLLQCFGATAWAQAISGVVKDSTGAVLPGVTVEAASQALIEKTRTVVTDSAGQYKVVSLRPGTYSVTYTLQGFTMAERKGIELSGDFTATVDVVLQIGSVTESVQVTTGTPLIDVTAVNAETLISQAILRELPVAPTPLGFAAVTLGASISLAGQDVGGSKGEQWLNMSFHGGHGSEQRLLLDNMVFNTFVPAGHTFFASPIGAQEFTLTTGEGGAAESQGGGVNINEVPRDGGNAFHGLVDLSGSTSSLQGSNLTPFLQSRGATASSHIQQLWDYGFGVGGSVIRDRLWFFASYRHWGNKTTSPSLQNNADVNAYTYKTTGVAALQNNLYRNENIRLTWQATPRNKFTAQIEAENHVTCNGGSNCFGAPVTSLEATVFAHWVPNEIYQGTWTMPVNNKLLIEAGAMWYHAGVTDPAREWDATDQIQVNDTGIGIIYRAPTNNYRIAQPQGNARWAVSYVTGTHHYKVGGMLLGGYQEYFRNYAPSATSYTFNNGVPTSITEYAVGAPQHVRWGVWPTIGLYAQDKWTIKQRFTLSYGLRYDHRGNYVPANDIAAGVFVPARHFDRVDCVPCWNDINPRLGAAYDLFGTGTTVVKASIGRYVLQQLTQIAQAADPAATTVASTTRAWTDANGNFKPDCDLTNPNLQSPTTTPATADTCGKIANSTFGSNVVTTTYDPQVLNGWQHSPYNWQMSAAVQQRIGPNVAVSASYFRTWYGNFTVTDNQLVTPSDYSAYCFTAPVNPALPGGGGNQICGLYDLNRDKVGQVNNLVTFASKYGKQKEAYNGVDLGIQVRLGQRLTMNGGVSIGNSDGSTSSQNNCFVVDSPQQLYLCDQPYPMQAQVKFQGSYRFPWGIQFSGTVQSLAGAPILATYAVPNSAIAPTLGRNLSACAADTGACTSTASVNLVRPKSMWEPRLNQLDMQFTKTIRVGEKMTVKPAVILANILNGSAIEAENTTYGSKWRTPTLVLDPRLARIALRIEF